MMWPFGKKTAPVSREALSRAHTDHAEAQAAVAAIEARIERLNRIIAAEAEAETALSQAVTGEGAINLEDFGRGNASPIGAVVADADAASRAAQIARKALPQAERELQEARVRARSLDAVTRGTAAAVLVDHCDAIGAEYVETFKKLRRLHDRLVGMAQGAARAGGRADIVLAVDPLEVPRFAMPSMPPGPEGYSPYLRHVPDSRMINAMATACQLAVNRIVADPRADISDLFADDALLAAIDRAGRPGEARAIEIRQRQRPEPAPVNDVMFGGEDRTRREIKLFRAAG